MSFDALRTLALIGLLFILKIHFNKYQLDKFRDELFNIRRELFLMAAGEDYSLKFNSDIYKNINCLLNNMIRFAHDVSFLQALLFILFNKISFRNSADIENLLIKNIFEELNSMRDQKKKEKLAEIMETYNKVIALYMVKTSILFFVIVFFKFVQMNIKAILRHLKKKSSSESESYLGAAEYMMAWRVSKQAQYAVA